MVQYNVDFAAVNKCANANTLMGLMNKAYQE